MRLRACLWAEESVAFNQAMFINGFTYRHIYTEGVENEKQNIRSEFGRHYRHALECKCVRRTSQC
ncbi:hypothetical protein CBM2598_U10145 [Cupriavidus taiwanensis]|uniref:Uncharacterized protein n=1 Tax=Cupriavidus taiwanensis TaxID=164546 RepID=A0A7Z7NQ94_9BURK|nr:hypothetical protein CBM2597_U10207 [Cupriavidus taiwanensis]SOZ96335.1 hypothetical protein CBM2598_U10145 [Cupriavidus taiwanensis]SPC25712.1 hypothetical protein CBM2594_U10213 [Cupriavidus taiwanensis]